MPEPLQVGHVNALPVELDAPYAAFRAERCALRWLRARCVLEQPGYLLRCRDVAHFPLRDGNASRKSFEAVAASPCAFGPHARARGE